MTRIRIEIANANNPPVPSNSLAVTVTTRDSANNIIDGPSPTNAYNIKQIGTAEIADGAVTTTKIVGNAVTETNLSLDSVYTVWQDNTPGNFKTLYKRSTISFDPTGILSATVVGSPFINSGSPAVAASGNNVYVVWSEHTDDDVHLLYRRSTDGGATFGGTINLSNNAGSSDRPAIAASGNNVYVVWFDNTPGNAEILYRRSTDGGGTFGSTINLSNNAGSSFEPAIYAVNNLPV